MAHASRDPIFWATVAIAEQAFDGAGDLCIRCHVPEGWLGGRSTPTDGYRPLVQRRRRRAVRRLPSAHEPGRLRARRACRTRPSSRTTRRHRRRRISARGMAVLLNGTTKLGPYANAAATHQFLQSTFHRSADLCGTCHDVSNPVVGDLAHNHGAQTPLAPGQLQRRARRAGRDEGRLQQLPVPVRRRRAHLQRAPGERLRRRCASPTTRRCRPSCAPARSRTRYQAALLAGNGGDYEDGTPRTFTCQTCHMRPTIGQGCNKNPPLRADLPLHDLTGGNYWVPGRDPAPGRARPAPLRRRPERRPGERNARRAGARASRTSTPPHRSSVTGNQARVVNLTGHKLISGYPEGRRMWLRVRWYDAGDALLAEDGAYGSILADLDGTPTRGRHAPRPAPAVHAHLRGARGADPGVGHAAPRARASRRACRSATTA